MPRNCGCGGSKKSAGSQNFQHIDATGKVIKVYSTETDARMAASQQPGTRVRPA